MDFRGRRPEKACVGSPRPRSNLLREINVCDEVSLETTFESFALLLCIGRFVDAQLIEREPEDRARPTMWRFVRGTENGAVSLVPQDGEFHEACALIPVEPASAFVDHRLRGRVVSFEFDQSFYVTDALNALRFEGLLGALLAGGIIFLALGSFRSAFVDVTTIPLALLSALVALWASGQTINLMTLGGLTLAIGILVDESVIAVENIHRHLGDRKPVARAVLSASGEVVVPRLLIMLSILAVFAPSFFLAGVARAMFVPLALAVGFAMVASFFLASTFVPIVETWLQPGGWHFQGDG